MTRPYRRASGEPAGIKPRSQPPGPSGPAPPDDSVAGVTDTHQKTAQFSRLLGRQGARAAAALTCWPVLAFIVHWAGGGVLNLRLGHFDLNVGFT